MGLDATIKRADGQPLGPVAVVKQALADAFPGIVLGRLPSGVEKIEAAAKQGVVFQDSIHRHFETCPAQYGGDFQGTDFSAQFNLGAAETVQQVDVVLYGTTVASEPMFKFLEQHYGWVTTGHSCCLLTTNPRLGLESEIMKPADDVYGWVEQDSTVMFKAVTKYGDPVELSAAEARAVAEALLKLAARLDSLE